jgi:hypothetical protein
LGRLGRIRDSGAAVSTPAPALVAALSHAVTARSGRREGGEIRFQCPAHDDHRPSARWNPKKAVWHCDACGAGGGALDLAERLGIEPPVVAVHSQLPCETVYAVRDAAGGVVAEHVRIDDAKGKKRFFWRRDSRRGLGELRTAELPLYGTECVAGYDRSRPLFVVEGEKAAEHLQGIGAQAVGTVTGASAAQGAGPLSVLRGWEVVLWPDADAPGARHMERIAAALAGVASAVRVFAPPPGLPAGGDAADWIEQRRAAGKQAAAMLSEIEALALEAPGRAAEGARGYPGGAGKSPDAVEAALAGLAAAAGIEAAGDWLRRLREALRGADGLARRLARERALAALDGKVKAPAQLVDVALMVQPLPAPGNGRAVEFAEPEPWPEPVEGGALLGELAATFTRFVALPRFADVAAALWTVHAHAHDAAGASPLLALTSPAKRCGKTTMLSLLARLVPRALLSSNISPASLFRIVERYSPTLLIDEADSFMRDNEELRGILNSGHTRDAAYVVRTVGDDHEPRRFFTWAAKALALIGRLPDTLADRSIVIPMRRRAPGEQVERLRLDRPGAFEDLRRRAARWAADHLDELRAADPEVPGEIGDRAADNWRPLLAIADLGGGEWPEQARQAALALSGAGVDAPDSLSSQLLADIRDVFRQRAAERMFTEELLHELRAREDRPWGEWRGSNPMSAIQLAHQLKPFDIRPRLFREGAKSARGYLAADLADAFARYLPADPLHPLQVNPDAGLGGS